MPIFMDRHDVAGVSLEELSEAHRLDLQAQDKYGVKFITMWYDQHREHAFCLIDSPDEETARRIHAETHGNLALDVIPVDLSAVEAFLGRLADPKHDQLTRFEDIEPTAFRSVMFTDIVGSTAMTSRLGDEKSVEMVRAHDAVVRRALKDTGGREVKHTGDGIMASFNDTAEAVKCARMILTSLDFFNMGSEEKLNIRIGMDAGEPVEDSNDLFGGTVQMAARLCAAAETDTIYVSSVMRDLTSSQFDMVEVGTRELKGFPEPVTMYEVPWR